MAVGIFGIIQERKELESCGFHHSKGYTAGHKKHVESDWFSR
jgi:hypothetical protein